MNAAPRHAIASDAFGRPGEPATDARRDLTRPTTGAPRFGIRARLLVVITLVACVFGGATVAVLGALGDVDQAYDRLLGVDERLLLDATRLRVLAEREVTTSQALPFAGAGTQRTRAELDGINRAQDQLLGEIAHLATAPGDAAFLQRLRVANLDHDRALGALVDATIRGDQATAERLWRDEVTPARQALLTATDELIDRKTAARDAARIATRERMWRATNILSISLVIGAFLTIAVAIGFGGRLAGGTVAIAAAVRRLASGDLRTPVPRPSDGELHALAADVEDLRQQLLRARQAAAAHRARVLLLAEASRALLAAADVAGTLAALAERTRAAVGAVAVRATLSDLRTGAVIEAARVGLEPLRPPDGHMTVSPGSGTYSGDLSIWLARPGDLSADELALAETLAAEAGLALRNAVAAESVLRRAEELNTFVNVVAHDVRGPVALAQRLTELIRLRNPILAATEAPLFARIGDATAYAEALIDDLRDLARLGQLPPRRESVSLAAAIRDVHSAEAASLLERDIELSVRVDLTRVEADPRQVRQILTNLIENATRYMGRGSEPPRITIEARARQAWCQIGVLDNGRGIPEDQREAAFLPFRRGGGAGDEETPGMGMGLAIVRRIVESHGGTIWIDEAPGGGCAVWFTLPLAAESAPDGPALEGTAVAEQP